MSLGRCLRFLHRRTYAQGIAAAGLGAAAVFIARTASPACSKEGRSTLEQVPASLSPSLPPPPLCPSPLS